MSEKTVVCRELKKAFTEQAVVQDVSFELDAGRILALLGPSGCGKTTTLRLIAGFERLDGGRVEIAGQLVASARLHLPPEKRRIGMVFQDYAIFPHLNVADNVSFGLGRGKEAKTRTAEMLEMVGLRGMGEQMPHELSGGQQQRVALARALAPDPVILLLDEPFSNLDTSLRAQVRQEVRELLKENGTTAVFVTHDQEEALFLGDRIALMNQGKLEQVGTPEQIYHQPQTRFAARFMGQTDFVPGQVQKRGVNTPLGLLPQALDLPAGANVEVAVRPDDVDLVAEGGSDGGDGSMGGAGIIETRQFMGIAYVYQIRLMDGSRVHSWQPHTLNLAPGTAVRARFRLDHPLSCFFNGEIVP